MALWREAVEKGGSLVDNIQYYYIHVKNQVSTAGSTPPCDEVFKQGTPKPSGLRHKCPGEKI
jgi:hypothetical protein